MAPDGKRPTLRDVVAFYALEEDSIPCTVRETWGESDQDATARADAPLSIGDELQLCLD
jgi:hypothetical protein